MGRWLDVRDVTYAVTLVTQTKIKQCTVTAGRFHSGGNEKIKSSRCVGRTLRHTRSGNLRKTARLTIPLESLGHRLNFHPAVKKRPIAIIGSVEVAAERFLLSDVSSSAGDPLPTGSASPITEILIFSADMADCGDGWD